MSLLNITNDGLPNILTVLHATVLRATKPMAEADLLDAVSPAAIVEDDGQMARNTLNRWTELGLFVRENGLITVKEKLSGRRATALEILPFTRRMACRQALAEENNPDLWASQSARAADLTRSLAWMLAQDVYRASFAQFETQESQQILDPERLLMRNSTRRSGLQYLGALPGVQPSSICSGGSNRCCARCTRGGAWAGRGPARTPIRRALGDGVAGVGRRALASRGAEVCGSLSAAAPPTRTTLQCIVPRAADSLGQWRVAVAAKGRPRQFGDPHRRGGRPQ